MEQLKVRRKDSVVFNSIIFLILSFLFLYLQYAYRHQLSPLSVTYLRKSIELFWYVSIPMGLAIFFLWRIRYMGIYLYTVCTLLVSYKVIEGLFIEFNKVIVVALFFYVIISYFIYQILDQYFATASINANYDSGDLFPPMLREIPCVVTVGEQNISGVLTNWDEGGCFIKLKEKKSLPRKVSLLINFEGREFSQEGEVVAQSHDFHGVGIKFKTLSKSLKTFNWAEFVELVHELGFGPERLR
jgi:hypothetical protein